MPEALIAEQLQADLANGRNRPGGYCPRSSGLDKRCDSANRECKFQGGSGCFR